MARDRRRPSRQIPAKENLMRRTLVRLSAVITLTLAAILTGTGGANASSVMIIQAFARASATPTAKSGAAYVSLMNHAAEADRLISAATPVAEMAEIHKSDVVDGIMKMQAAGPLDIPAMGTLEMKPGGYHIMLMGLVAPLKRGDEIQITLTFEKAGQVTVKVPVGEVAQGTHGHGTEGSEGSGG
jgi:copper(I)-binding protein